MPDSFLPPPWGPGSFDERDLDAVLSGETADIPVALRSVADTLAALRGAPTPAEFGGEATIMAEFRALGLGEAGRPDGPAKTLELRVLPADSSPRRAARHRARRRAVPPVSRRTGALMGAAAAVLIVVAVAFSSLPGPIQRFTHLGRTAGASPSAAHTFGGISASPGGLQGTGAAAKPPTTSDPAPARSQVVPSSTPSSAASSLCQEVFGYRTHPESRASRMSRYQQLSKLAGGSDLTRVVHYCLQVLGSTFHGGDSGTGSQSSQSQGKGPGRTGHASQSLGGGSARTGQGDTGSGNGGSSGNDSSGPGQGSQGGGGPASNP